MSYKKSSESHRNGYLSPLLQSAERVQGSPLLFGKAAPFPGIAERAIDYLLDMTHPDLGEPAVEALTPQIERLKELNPNKFYVENVRVLLETSPHAAKEICERGVQEGVFDRWVEVLDPETSRTIATAPNEKELPSKVVLATGFHNEDDEPRIVSVSGLKKLTCYGFHQK